MKKNTNTQTHFNGYLIAAIPFVVSFLFFLIAYPYHLIRREQMSLFLYDGDYIRQTYHGMGWFARMAGDFLEQFFHLPAVGPIVVALLLTAIAVVTYRIFRKFIGRWPSLAVASLMFLWSFMRETGNLYVTRYTIVVLCYLSLVLLALQFKKLWSKSVAAVLLLAIGVWSLGAPVHKNYGKAWGVPRIEYDRIIGLDDEVAREHWDKVLKLSRKDLYMVEASYCYNLAQAMKGNLGESLFDHSQSGPYEFLLRVIGDQSVFTNGLAGEAWFHLGSMTIAEQSAITSLQASPNHTGVRYLLRLARVNLITGEDAAAQKYLNLLSKTLFYSKWAKSMMPDNQDDAARSEILRARARLTDDDFVHLSDQPRAVLLGLLDADPDNDLARNYLLCYDLLRYDLVQFMEDYDPERVNSRIYKEAALIWLSQQGILTDQTAADYGIETSMMNKMSLFFRYPNNYRNTYWYYYMEAKNVNAR